MTSVRTARLQRSALFCGCALGALTIIAAGSAGAQSAGPATTNVSPTPVTAANQNSTLDMDIGPAPPAAPAAPANPNSGLDMGADNGPPAAASATVAAAPAPAPVPPTAAAASTATSGTPAAAQTVPGKGTAPTALAGVAAAASGPVSASVPTLTGSTRYNVQDGAHIAIVDPEPSAAPPAAGQTGGTQVSIASPAVPVIATPAAPTIAPPAAPPAASPGTPTIATLAAPTVAAPAAQPEPINLDHPTVVSTDTLKAGDVTVSLFGIDGVQGEAAEGMQGFLTGNAGRVTCQAENTAGFVCLLPDGTDVAEVALVNGAARVKDDAPPAYQDQQAAAQAARRGIWADLPPPPAIVKHPAVQDTATLVADGQTYRLDGIIGLGAPYAQQLQGYIQSNGDMVTCMTQGADGYYTCALADGTDLAKVALVNGAARVAADAPDVYRVQQGLALSNHRGFWVNPPQDVLLAMSTAQAEPVCCALEAGDDGTDGITYVDGVPEAVIDGAPVFLVFAGAVGWGYYDHFHHWHGAPDRFRHHLEHFHPDGHGLRGYGHEAALRHDEALRHDAALREDPARRDMAIHRDAAFHAESMHGAVPHPGPAGGYRPGPAGGFHPAPAGGFHPAPGGGFRPGMAGMPHPAGGFVHPGPSLGGFHPGAAPAAHVASVAHVSSGRK